jgi:hypothetical protein
MPWRDQRHGLLAERVASQEVGLADLEQQVEGVKHGQAAMKEGLGDEVRVRLQG